MVRKASTGENKMSFETEEELKFEKFKNKELENKLKNRDEEIERLKAIIERGNEIRNNWENNEYQEAAHYNWLDDENHRIEQHGLNLELQLKEREDLIKELIDTFDLFDEVPLPFKIVNKMESVVKKSREVLKELGGEG